MKDNNFRKMRSQVQSKLWQNPDYKKHMSEVHKGKPNVNKGKKISFNTGKTHFQIGHIPHNKGCKGYINQGSFKNKHLVWNEGKTKENEPSLKIVSEKLRGRKKTVEHIEKVKLANIGRKATEEAKRKMKVKRALQITPKRDTSIEVKIQNFLKELGIEFFTHQYMKEIEHGYQCDILIPSMNLIIECDGDFIHCNPLKYSKDFVRYPSSKKIITAKEIWEKDKLRTKELIEKGFKVLRLWEFEIKAMDLNKFGERLKWI